MEKSEGKAALSALTAHRVFVFFPPPKFVFQLVISIYLFIYLYFFFLVCDGFFAFSDSSPLFEIMMVSSRRTNGSCAAFSLECRCAEVMAVAGGALIV